MWKTCAASLLILLSAAALPAEEDVPGKEVPSFYSRVVTGPLKNQSVCFVCRNGDRPTVMVITRKLTPELKLFLRNVDRLVDDHRASGLKCFGVYLQDELLPAIAQVQTFAFEARLKLPLTVGSSTITAASCLDIAPEIETAIVLYRNKSIVASHNFAPEKFTREQMQPLLREIVDLVMPAEPAETSANEQQKP